MSISQNLRRSRRAHQPDGAIRFPSSHPPALFEERRFIDDQSKVVLDGEENSPRAHRSSERHFMESGLSGQPSRSRGESGARRISQISRRTPVHSIAGNNVLKDTRGVPELISNKPKPKSVTVVSDVHRAPVPGDFTESGLRGHPSRRRGESSAQRISRISCHTPAHSIAGNDVRTKGARGVPELISNKPKPKKVTVVSEAENLSPTRMSSLRQIANHPPTKPRLAMLPGLLSVVMLLCSLFFIWSFLY